jgi:hypothetical protein
LLLSHLSPDYSIDFLTLTDISTLATMLYIAYPTALVLISIALWVVMIGIIKLVDLQLYWLGSTLTSLWFPLVGTFAIRRSRMPAAGGPVKS